MKVPMGSLSLEIPDSWNDRTVYTFVAPRVVDPRMSPHLRMRSGFRENISIHFEQAPRGATPESFLEGQLEQLAPRLQGFRPLYSEAVYLSGHPAFSAAYQFSLRGQKLDVCQLRVVLHLQIQSRMLVFTGTAAAHVFESKKRVFWQILRSLELPSAGF